MARIGAFGVSLRPFPSRLEHSFMSRKAPDRLTDDVAGALPASPKQAVMEGMSDIPDFTPEEWEWL